MKFNYLNYLFYVLIIKKMSSNIHGYIYKHDKHIGRTITKNITLKLLI